MRASELMSFPVVAIGATASLKEAAGVLVQHEITAAPVVDESEGVVGIVSEADLLFGDVFEPDPTAHMIPPPLEHDLPPRTVAEVMARWVLTLPANADAAQVAAFLVGHRVTSVPISTGVGWWAWPAAGTCCGR